MNIDKTLNNLFLFIHLLFISEFCSGIIDFLNLDQHSPNDSAGGGGGQGRGVVGEGIRLWLFIYCYIDIKLTQ